MAVNTLSSKLRKRLVAIKPTTIARKILRNNKESSYSESTHLLRHSEISRFINAGTREAKIKIIKVQK